MTCRELIDFLDDYVAGDLPGDRRKVFEEHLAGCPDCVHYLASYRQTIALAREAFEDREDDIPADVPGDLIKAILAARPSADEDSSSERGV